MARGFLLTVGMLKNADNLLQVMKQQIDCILAKDDKFQHFLVWVEQKSNSIKNSYKLVALRAYYLAIDFAHNHNHNHNLIYNLDFSLSCSLNLHLAHDQALIQSINIDPDFTRIDLDLNLDCACTIAYLLSHILSYCKDPPDCDISKTFVKTFADTFANTFENVILTAGKIGVIDLQRSLEQIRNQLPDFSAKNKENCRQWWQANGIAWTEQLRSIMIEHQNIGHDWQFSEKQKKLLQQYYDANKLLVDCLNSDCYVSREVRESIESTLLLPIASIEKLKSS